MKQFTAPYPLTHVDNLNRFFADACQALPEVKEYLSTHTLRNGQIVKNECFTITSTRRRTTLVLN